jgi:hypothetical protein
MKRFKKLNPAKDIRIKANKEKKHKKHLLKHPNDLQAKKLYEPN